jgi:hypothetical protein
VNEYYSELNIRFITQDIASNISVEELALIESVMPDLILAMLQNDDQDDD